MKAKAEAAAERERQRKQERQRKERELARLNSASLASDLDSLLAEFDSQPAAKVRTAEVPRGVTNDRLPLPLQRQRSHRHPRRPLHQARRNLK